MNSDSRQHFHWTCHPLRVPSLCGASVPTPPGGTTTTQALLTKTDLSTGRQQPQLGCLVLYFMSVFNISAPECPPCSLVCSALPLVASAATQRGQRLCHRRSHVTRMVCLKADFSQEKQWSGDTRTEIGRNRVGQVPWVQPLVYRSEYDPGPRASVCDPASCGACFSNFEAHYVQAHQLRPEGTQPGIKWNWLYSATATSQGGCIDWWGHPQRRRLLRTGVGAQCFSGATGEGAAMDVTLQRSPDCNLWPGSQAGWWEMASLRSKAWGRFWGFFRLHYYIFIEV